MNTRKILFACIASFALLAASCTPNTASDDVYDNGVDKTKIPSQKNG